MKVFMHKPEKSNRGVARHHGVFVRHILVCRLKANFYTSFIPSLLRRMNVRSIKKFIYESGHFPASLLQRSPWPKSNRDCINEAPFLMQNRRHDVISDMTEPKRTALIDERSLLVTGWFQRLLSLCFIAVSDFINL